MRIYILVDKATGEEIEADADTVERIIGVDLSYLDCVLKEDGKFENGDWEVHLSPIFGDPSGTEDLFAKWNRALKR